MKLSLAFLVLLFSSRVFSQQTDSLTNKPDSSSNKTITFPGQQNIIDSEVYNGNTRIGFTDYFILLGDDFKQDITAPFRQTPKEWTHIGIYAASVTAISLIADEPVQHLAISLHDSSKVIAVVSGNVTKFGGRYELYSLAALGAYGFIFNNKKMQTTTLLATQAYITSGLIETGLKYLTGRQRPSYYDPHHPESEPYFHGPAFSGGHNVYGQKLSTSFPSGHTTVAFAVATVFAKQYKNIAWVPPVAYGAATLVGLSRITENKHWTTDVIVGATLGYLCGRQVVNNYHRFEKKKAASRKRTLSFNVNYNGYNFEPQVTYTF